MERRIKVLDQATINKIAAGEVVENPSSVVKELVENSIDAGSSSITVEIRNGGIPYLRVTDDGIGIVSQDIHLAFERHATSKIKEADDLENINSLGFRGEALASIAAVSQMEIITKSQADDAGTALTIEGGKVVSKKSVGCPEGTTVVVRNLFYNTPARLKYLKTPSRETGQITEIINKMILSKPDIAFKYINNGKTMLVSPGDGNLLNAIAVIYGKDVIQDLVSIDYNCELFQMKGYIGKPGISKPSRRFQNIFVNHRYVKSHAISDAINSAYKTMVMINKYPFAVLYIYFPAEKIDVNVHPAKMEIRFDKQSVICQMITVQIRKALLNSVTTFKSPNISNFAKELKKTYVPVQVEKKAINKKIDNIGLNCIKHEKLEDNIKVSDQYKPIYDYKIIGQIFATYIIVEEGDKVYLIDQHAAHERLLFEKYKHMYKTSNVNRQLLVTPIVEQLPGQYMQIYKDNTQLLERLGFYAEEFGINTVSIREVPVFVHNDKIKSLFLDILDILLNDKTVDADDLVEKKIITKACKAAIKANDKLNSAEIIELLNKIRSSKIPPTCPHGRPILIEITKYELEKKFKRIQ
ncbi:MAG: DNA mismatch repair endonuclease MutL [Clostridia bacterium]|nr:DNA mismatch repair endonuclease MutL [Clostridia bacterium]